MRPGARLRHLGRRRAQLITAATASVQRPQPSHQGDSISRDLNHPVTRSFPKDTRRHRSTAASSTGQMLLKRH
jgi:hypothetical protein